LSRRPIAVLKTGDAIPPVKAIHGNFEDWIAAGLGCRLADLQVIDAHRGESLPAAREIAGVVITGSPAMVTERPDWSEASAAWLADLVRDDVIPALGLCYGHQLLAHALGGEVGKNPMGREMGTVQVTFRESRDLESSRHAERRSGGSLEPLFVEGVFPAHMSHVESVLRPPPGARVLATTALDPHSVLEFGPRQWGVQFHPEFDRPIMQGYVDARREILEFEGLDAKAMIESAVETPDLTSVLRRFSRVVESVS
jgi:GMP synthase (glutamine-hydrolysing)